jgi:Superinfection immunity protein
VVRADINFLAGIIKRRRPTAPYLSYATGTSRASDGEKTMESFVDGICNLIGFYLVLGAMLGIYIAPLVIAVVRDRHRLLWIGLLNVATRWTVAGWIAALVWSVTAIRQPAAIMLNGSPALLTAQPAAA